jgi:hypothetical protein
MAAAAARAVSSALARIRGRWRAARRSASVGVGGTSARGGGWSQETIRRRSPESGPPQGEAPQPAVPGRPIGSQTQGPPVRFGSQPGG